jgi:AcrR family transcriptional regulator
MKRSLPTDNRANTAADKARRAEILDTAARIFGSAGFHVGVGEIAEACGILPGSLYHHFESKEAIVIELIERYQIELDEIAERHRLRRTNSDPILDQIVSLAQAITGCGIRHRAAMLQTFYEPPANASERLLQIAKRPTKTIDDAMLSLLRAGRGSGYLRHDIDLTSLAVQLCQSMLHTGVGVSHLTAGADRISELKCHMLLQGLAAVPPRRAAPLEHSRAFEKATQAITDWVKEEPEGQAGLLHTVARAEFARRGFESTTVRDIAAASGLSTGTVYRLVGSKDELLKQIMTSYMSHVGGSWKAVLTAKSSPLERLYALIWINSNVLERFRDEFKIQLGWVRSSPPSTANLRVAPTFAEQMRLLKKLLAEGERSGQFRTFSGSLTLRASCLFELTWMSEHIVRSAGLRAAQALANNTVILGAAKRS